MEKKKTRKVVYYCILCNQTWFLRFPREQRVFSFISFLELKI